MALVDCKECGVKVSTKAKKCPSCGIKVKKRFGIIKWLIGIPLALIALLFVFSIISLSNMTPEQKANLEIKKQENAAEKAIRDKERAAEKLIADEKKAEAAEKAAAERAIKDKENAAEKAIRDKERAAEKLIADEKKAEAAKIKAEEESEKQALKTAEEDEKRRKGFHCLSVWNGTHSGVISRVKAILNDPDSFEHDETLVAPMQNGQHQFTMKYRAKNGFGAIMRGNALGTYGHEDCNDINLTQAQ